MARSLLLSLYVLSLYIVSVFSVPAPASIAAFPTPTNYNLIERDGDTCEADPWATDSPSTTGGPKETTKPNGGPAPSCEYRGPQPPLTPEGFCTCDNKSTLPLTSIPGTPVPESESCKYTVQPDPSVTTQLHDKAPQPTTYKDTCEICTPYAANAADCKIMSNCVPAKGAMTIELGSSAVNVGTLTSDALFTSISSALTKLCPTSGPSCKEGTVEIDGIAYAEKSVGETELNEDGKLLVVVHSSLYQTQSVRDSLIKSSAASVRSSATGKNCADLDYTHYKNKRWWDPISTFAKRQIFGGDWRPQNEKINLCSGLEFTGAHYYAPNVNVENVGSATSYIDAEWTFKKGDKLDLGRELICDFVTDLIDSAAIECPIVGSEAGAMVGLLCKGDLVQAIKNSAGIGS